MSDSTDTSFERIGHNEFQQVTSVAVPRPLLDGIWSYDPKYAHIPFMSNDLIESGPYPEFEVTYPTLPQIGASTAFETFARPNGIYYDFGWLNGFQQYGTDFAFVYASNVFRTGVYNGEIYAVGGVFDAVPAVGLFGGVVNSKPAMRTNTYNYYIQIDCTNVPTPGITWKLHLGIQFAGTPASFAGHSFSRATWDSTGTFTFERKYRTAGGVEWTNVLFTTPYALTSGSTIRLEAEGSYRTAKVNGVTIMDILDVTAGTGGDAPFWAHGYVGTISIDQDFVGGTPPTGNADRLFLDNYVVGDLYPFEWKTRYDDPFIRGDNLDGPLRTTALVWCVIPYNPPLCPPYVYQRSASMDPASIPALVTRTYIQTSWYVFHWGNRRNPEVGDSTPPDATPLTTGVPKGYYIQAKIAAFNVTNSILAMGTGPLLFKIAVSVFGVPTWSLDVVDNGGSTLLVIASGVLTSVPQAGDTVRIERDSTSTYRFRQEYRFYYRHQGENLKMLYHYSTLFLPGEIDTSSVPGVRTQFGGVFPADLPTLMMESKTGLALTPTDAVAQRWTQFTYGAMGENYTAPPSYTSNPTVRANDLTQMQTINVGSEVNSILVTRPPHLVGEENADTGF